MQAKRDGAIEVENEKTYESAGFATVLESNEIKQNSIKISSRYLNLKGIFSFHLNPKAVRLLSSYYRMGLWRHGGTVYAFLPCRPRDGRQRDVFHGLRSRPQPRCPRKITRRNRKLDGETLRSVAAVWRHTKSQHLDMVLSETLRLYPPVPFLDRRCNQKTIIENSDGTKVELQQGDGIYFPVTCIHHDEKYYLDPQRFDPERFSPENRLSIKPFSYLPFGVGQRNCIGSRFAIMEIKALFVSTLSNFTIEKSSRTEIPLQLKPDAFQNRPKNGVWLTLNKKTQEMWTASSYLLYILFITFLVAYMRKYSFYYKSSTGSMMYRDAGSFLI